MAQNNWGAFNVGFPGQYWDSEDGLWQNGFRDYDATTGRYIESDPIGLAGGVNTYAYVNNNPITYVDAFGLCDDHKCNKLQRGLAIGAVDANKFANATGNYATGVGVIAFGAAAAAPLNGGATLTVAAPLGAAAAGMGYISTATSFASGLLNTAASGGDFRYFGTAILTSMVGRMGGEAARVIPGVKYGTEAISGYLESKLGSWAALPPPCDLP